MFTLSLFRVDGGGIICGFMVKQKPRQIPLAGKNHSATPTDIMFQLWGGNGDDLLGLHGAGPQVGLL